DNHAQPAVDLKVNSAGVAQVSLQVSLLFRRCIVCESEKNFEF
ncbi:unnamed protein product, partial [Ascophyllum nodosum]